MITTSTVSKLHFPFSETSCFWFNKKGLLQKKNSQPWSAGVKSVWFYLVYVTACTRAWSFSMCTYAATSMDLMPYLGHNEFTS